MQQFKSLKTVLAYYADEKFCLGLLEKEKGWEQDFVDSWPLNCLSSGFGLFCQKGGYFRRHKIAKHTIAKEHAIIRQHSAISKRD